MFSCVQTMARLPVLGVLNVPCSPMLVQATAYRSSTNAVRESALKGDWGRKIPHHTKKSKLHQQLARLNTLPTEWDFVFYAKHKTLSHHHQAKERVKKVHHGFEPAASQSYTWHLLHHSCACVCWCLVVVDRMDLTLDFIVYVVLHLAITYTVEMLKTRDLKCEFACDRVWLLWDGPV